MPQNCPQSEAAGVLKGVATVKWMAAQQAAVHSDTFKTVNLCSVPVKMMEATKAFHTKSLSADSCSLIPGDCQLRTHKRGATEKHRKKQYTVALFWEFKKHLLPFPKRSFWAPVYQEGKTRGKRETPGNIPHTTTNISPLNLLSKGCFQGPLLLPKQQAACVLFCV
jgi:hypothetical protein